MPPRSGHNTLSIMKYLEFTFTTSPAGEAVHDVLAAVLAEVGFDSFVDTGSLDRPCVPGGSNPEDPAFVPASDTGQFKAYIRQDAFDAAALRAALEAFPLPGVAISYEQAEAEDKDWNAEWESHYFQPLVVGGRCVVASTFHHDIPKAEFTVLINPQMSFGTGHHATTSQMLGRLLDDDPQGRTVLDMGCGTGILAILARKRGAAACLAVDNDEWCVRNTRENIALNGVDGIDVRLGDATVLPDSPTFDVVLANINRNILLADMGRYAACMKPGAVIYMSGFYTDDTPRIREEAERQGLHYVDEREQERWACVKFEKV